MGKPYQQGAGSGGLVCVCVCVSVCVCMLGLHKLSRYTIDHRHLNLWIQTICWNDFRKSGGGLWSWGRSATWAREAFVLIVSSPRLWHSWTEKKPTMCDPQHFWAAATAHARSLTFCLLRCQLSPPYWHLNCVSNQLVTFLKGKSIKKRRLCWLWCLTIDSHGIQLRPLRWDSWTV